MFHLQNSILTEIHSDFLEARNIKLFIKRDDLIHAEVSGNKWRKLKYNIELCRSKKKAGVLTFGGAFSNHLVATAAACQLAGLKSIGIVRGDELSNDSNETLQRCTKYGMHLVFISREDYSNRNDKTFQEELMVKYPEFQLVPEGGANYYGMIGCQEIMQEVSNSVDHIFVAQGTTTTSCGIAMSLLEKQILHVVPVLKNFDSKQEMTELWKWSGFDTEVIEDWLKNVEVLDKYHFGGYGKYTDELLDFINNFYKENSVKLDPVYTGKAMFALMKEILKERFNNTSMLFVHTGGVQGTTGIENRSGRTLY